jgi:hypothetical protein
MLEGLRKMKEKGIEPMSLDNLYGEAMKKQEEIKAILRKYAEVADEFISDYERPDQKKGIADKKMTPFELYCKLKDCKDAYINYFGV